MSFDKITSRSFSAQGKANYDRIFRPRRRQPEGPTACSDCASETCAPEPSPDTGGGVAKPATDAELRARAAQELADAVAQLHERAAQELADAIDRGLVPTC